MDEIIFLKKIQNYNFGIIKMIYLILSNCNYKDEYKYKKIIIETDEFLIFTPIDETDEIKMEIKKNYKFSKNKCIYFDAYNGQKVFDIK